MWFYIRSLSSIFNSLIKQGECKFKNMSKEKVKSLCKAFIDLNKCVAVLLQEVIYTGKLSDSDIDLRQNAVSVVTAHLMTEIFEGEDANEVSLMMKDLRYDTISELERMLDIINNPN